MPPLIRQTISRRHEGTEILRAVFSVPPDLPPGLSDLVRDVEIYVDAILKPRAEEAFLKDPHPDKRFYFPRFEYRLEVNITPESSDTALLDISASLVALTEQAQGHFAHRFRLSDGVLLPPKKEKRRQKAPFNGGNPKNSAK